MTKIAKQNIVFKELLDARATCLDSCSDRSSGCDAQTLLAKVDHGFIASLFGLNDVLIDLLQGDTNHSFTVHKSIGRDLP